VSGRHARFEALLPPGVRSATVSTPGQAGTARRCSPGILTLQSSLHHGSGFGLSRIPTGRPRGPPTCVSGRPAVAVARRDPDSDAWVREPRIRRCAESIELHAPPSGGDPAHRAPRERSGAPVTSSPGALSGVDGASCQCPLSAAPRASCPWRPPPRRETHAGPRRRLDRTVDHSRPSRGGVAIALLAGHDLIAPFPGRPPPG